MRAAVLPILVMLLAACLGPPDPSGLLSVVEVAAGRLLDGDLAGALTALARV